MPVNIAIYMHITVNGMIARLDNSDFSSESAKMDFLKTMKKYKVNVIGRNTFNVASKSSSFPLEGLNIVVTKHNIKLKKEWKNVIVTDKKPKEIIRIIKEKGYSSAMVAGGALATSFLTPRISMHICLAFITTKTPFASTFSFIKSAISFVSLSCT